MAAVCQIEPITEKYIEGFHHAVDVVARERKFLAFLEAPVIECTRDYVLNNIKQGFPHFVAQENDQVVGWCDIIPDRSRPVHFHRGVVGIGLLPPYRGKGLGRKIMQRALDAAFDFGLTRIDLTVREPNLNAFKLYKSLGFEVEGLQRNAICIDGQYENVIAMALLKP
jgi:RimJ/RimL family protein N-acetyltransferase